MEDRIQYLFRQYLENTCSREEMEEFFAYIRESKRDAALRDMIRKLHEAIRTNPSLLTYVDETGNLVLTEPQWNLQPATISKSSHPRRIKTILLTVLVLAALSVLWPVTDFYRHTLKQAIARPLIRKTTEWSEYKYLLLPDSTQVWLNAGSSLEFPDHFNENKREVVLSGEAYFDVKHADQIPFVIHTGKVSTTVLGTAFNIKAYPNRKNIIVAVSRGKVKVSLGDQLIATLSKGEQVKVNSWANNMAARNIAPAEVAAWQQGRMIYEDEDFEDIIADLERTYNVKVKVDNASVLNLKISTSFSREIGIEHALQILCKLTDSDLKHSTNEYIIR